MAEKKRQAVIPNVKKKKAYKQKVIFLAYLYPKDSQHANPLTLSSPQIKNFLTSSPLCAPT